jgi:signal transduction histidine kinase
MQQMTNSLRSKIILSHTIPLLALLMVSVLIFIDLRFLRNEIIESDNISLLFSATQQLQNYEENLLLHRAPAAYSLLRDQLKSSVSSFEKIRESLARVAQNDELDKLRYYLSYYGALLENIQSPVDDIELALQNDLRTTSESINSLVRQLGQRHHSLLDEVTQIVFWTLVFALTMLSVIKIGSGYYVIRKVIKPINLLEHQLDLVADGEMKSLTLVTNDNEIQSFVGHFNNMLVRLRIQQSQLRHHEKAAALGVLVSGVAHELNNPLSNISTSVQLLLEDDDDTRHDMRTQWLAHIDSESERARRIVRRLLDSVRQPKQNIQSVNTAALVRSATMLIHRQLDPEIGIDIEDVADLCIQVNRERFQQVFINLIRNAVDAGARNIWVFGDVTNWEDSKPDDIERVQGEVSLMSEADELMLFTVADDGPGIPEENLAQLFTPFFTTKTSGEGTGLGLYLVHEIVEEHNGCIAVENRIEGGTQFMIWLPISKEECTS